MVKGSRKDGYDPEQKACIYRLSLNGDDVGLGDDILTVTGSLIHNPHDVTNSPALWPLKLVWRGHTTLAPMATHINGNLESRLQPYCRVELQKTMYS
jgi:hypothetical protein